METEPLCRQRPYQSVPVVVFFVVVDAAFASTDGMVVVLHVVETDTT